jgi:putative MATE family efflux protein
MDATSKLSRSPRAVFTEGATMRHVLVMTATGSIGLIAIFIVDLFSLIYVSWLHDERLMAAVGFASQVMFFGLSINIGITIAVAALVSRALGADDRAGAQRLAASGLIQAAGIAGGLVLAAYPFRVDLLQVLGARDSTLEIASGFLAITLPSNVLMALGMALSGVLRAAGDARRAMYVTLAGGIVTAFTDPLFIFGFGFGVNGAAIATVISRFVFVGVGLHGAIYVHGLVGRPNRVSVLRDVPAMMAIAVPAILANLATPVANSFSLRIFAGFGEPVVAAFAIFDRIIPVAFGVIFAMTSSVGPILGQNLGAKLPDRVRSTLSNCFVLSGIYVLAMWALLAMLAPAVAILFGASGETRRVVIFLCRTGIAAWFFISLLFVANAAFNNLGFPMLSTLFNWGRATFGTIPFVATGTAWYGVEGGIVGIIISSLLFGLAAVVTAYWVTAKLANRLRSG